MQGPAGPQGIQGLQGVGVKSITSGTPTVVNDKTNTPITITLTDNTTVDLVVSAENGKDGTSATVDIVQATGQSTTAVMSQKATTDELNKKANSAALATVATSGSYNDLSDKPIIPFTPFSSDDLSTGTYRSTNLPSGCSLIYIEDREKRLSGYFYSLATPASFQELYFITSYYTTASGRTTLVIYKLKINGAQVEKTYKNLFVTSSGSVEVGDEYVEGGTFYYKVLK